MVVSRALLEHPELINWTLLGKAVMGLLALLCGEGFYPFPIVWLARKAPWVRAVPP